MSKANPYEQILNGREPQAVLAATPAKLVSLARVMGAEKLNQPLAPGKWSPREILCHLADCELAFSFRLRQTLAEDHYTAQAFDQDLWAKPYAGLGAEEALAAFTALRHWNLLLFRAVLPEAAEKLFTHPERGTMSFMTMVETIAGHDLNHLVQLEKVAG
jgi:hypothetical protein